MPFYLFGTSTTYHEERRTRMSVISSGIYNYRRGYRTREEGESKLETSSRKRPHEAYWLVEAPNRDAAVHLSRDRMPRPTQDAVMQRHNAMRTRHHTRLWHRIFRSLGRS
jgi:hypothetical protein